MKSIRLLSKSSGLALSLVMGIDFFWGMLVTGPVWDLFALWLETSQEKAHRMISESVEPMLWWSYGLVYLGQVWWFVKTARKEPVTEERLRRANQQWWSTLVLLFVTGMIQRVYVVTRIDPDMPIRAILVLIMILLVDLLVVYWLPARLMTPKAYLSAVPNWTIGAKKK